MGLKHRVPSIACWKSWPFGQDPRLSWLPFNFGSHHEKKKSKLEGRLRSKIAHKKGHQMRRPRSRPHFGPFDLLWYSRSENIFIIVSGLGAPWCTPSIPTYHRKKKNFQSKPACCPSCPHCLLKKKTKFFGLHSALFLCYSHVYIVRVQ